MRLTVEQLRRVVRRSLLEQQKGPSPVTGMLDAASRSIEQAAVSIDRAAGAAKTVLARDPAAAKRAADAAAAVSAALDAVEDALQNRRAEIEAQAVVEPGAPAKR